MKKVWKFCLLSVLVLSFAAPLVVNAATVMRYNGQGIWSWRSVNEWKVSHTRRYSVNHYQTANPGSGGYAMNVSIYKKQVLGGKITSSKYSGTSGGSFSTSLSPGTYYLRFDSTGRAKTFDVSGTVTD